MSLFLEHVTRANREHRGPENFLFWPKIPCNDVIKWPGNNPSHPISQSPNAKSPNVQVNQYPSHPMSNSPNVQVTQRASHPRTWRKGSNKIAWPFLNVFRILFWRFFVHWVLVDFKLGWVGHWVSWTLGDLELGDLDIGWLGYWLTWTSGDLALGDWEIRWLGLLLD